MALKATVAELLKQSPEQIAQSPLADIQEEKQLFADYLEQYGEHPEAQTLVAKLGQAEALLQSS
jgi:hypothetical protein